MLVNKLRCAAHHTTKFLNRSVNTGVKYARMFDQGMDTLGRIAKAVVPTVDHYAGTSTARQAKQINDDYQILRARVMGVHNESQAVGNHLMGNLRRNVPELGLQINEYNS